jgi:DNA-directed RNA polymerase specialized sigma24 family protein
MFRSGRDTHDAEDLVQGFIADKILDRDLLARASERRGRFRSLLLRSLENYVIDQIRRKRSSGSNLAAAGRLGDDEHRQLDKGEATLDPFDVAWARQVLEQAVAKMRDGCREQGHHDRWRVFEMRVLRPFWNGQPEPTCEELMTEFGFASPRQASNALVTAKRHFRRMLEETVAEYLCDGENVDDELKQLALIVGQAGSLEIDFSRISSGSSTVACSADSSSTGESLGPSSQVTLWHKLLGADDIPTHPWSEPELRAIWLDKLEISAPGSANAATLGELLRAPSPPIESLKQVKELARSWACGEQEDVPAEVAWALYFATIAAAYVRHGLRISRLDDNMLRQGLETLGAIPWLDSGTCQLVDLALRKLNSSGNANTLLGDISGKDVDEKLARLTDQRMRLVAELKLGGYTHDEIAERLGCSLRSVERKWASIQRLWRTPS